MELQNDYLDKGNKYNYHHNSDCSNKIIDVRLLKRKFNKI